MSVEFKRCGSQPGQDTFETICSFANRQGGSVLLGVRDDGTVEGVLEVSALSIERNISNVISNPNLFNVSPLVEFERLRDADGKLVIRVRVPMGPSLYTFKGAVYDRVADADVRVKSDAQITSMMARKQSYYSERTVYSWVPEEDLEMGLLDMVRDALRANDADHPWLSLSDEELLRAARLYGRDQLTGERGFNFAAVALLGKEDTILDVMPLYRTDAVLRRVETDRYDDRLVCRSNLVRAYDELVGFCEKWLPDSFVLDGGQRKSARDVIVRELVCNCLIHREFVNPHIARITIDREGIRTSNASRALFAGPVTLESLDRTPSSPTSSRRWVVSRSWGTGRGASTSSRGSTRGGTLFWRTATSSPHLCRFLPSWRARQETREIMMLRRALGKAGLSEGPRGTVRVRRSKTWSMTFSHVPVRLPQRMSASGLPR